MLKYTSTDSRKKVERLFPCKERNSIQGGGLEPGLVFMLFELLQLDHCFLGAQLTFLPFSLSGR